MRSLLNGIHFLCIFLLISCATAPGVVLTPDVMEYTYDGEFDPTVFFSWDVVEVSVYEDEYIYFDLRNPDQDADVKAARTINIPSQYDSESVILIAYWYFKGDVKYMFVLEEDRAHYAQVLPDWGI